MGIDQACVDRCTAAANKECFSNYKAQWAPLPESCGEPGKRTHIKTCLASIMLQEHLEFLSASQEATLFTQFQQGLPANVPRFFGDLCGYFCSDDRLSSMASYFGCGRCRKSVTCQAGFIV